MTDSFQLATLLAHLECLKPERVADCSTDDLALTLTAFVFSNGQRLHLPPERQALGWTLEQLLPFSRRYLPFFTAPDFPAVAERQVRILALATTCRILHLVLLDWVVDNPATATVETKLALQHVFLQDCCLLSLLFSPHSPFWTEFERLLTLTSQAIFAERRDHGSQVRPYPWAEFQQIAWQKMANVQSSVVAMAYLNGSPEDISFLQECWEAIAVAGVINDDVMDWQEDYENANYSYPLSQILLAPEFRAEVLTGQLPAPAEVGAALLCSNVVEKMYARARDTLQAAEDRADRRGYPTLARLLRQTADWMEERQTEVIMRKLLAIFDPAVN